MAPPCRVMFETMERCPIWLVGMMGAGKPALGSLPASSLGGAIAQPTAAAHLGRTSTVVHLKASASSLLGRLGDCSDRPLLRDLEPEGCVLRLEALLAERASACETAVIAVDTDTGTIEAVAEEILRRLAAERPGHESNVEKGACN